MNTKKILTTAVLALMMTACSEEYKEAVIQSNGGNEITITATIDASSDSTLTRAVAESGTAITSSLTVDEQIAVLFSDGTNNLNRTATVKSVADGTATIEFTIPSTLANNTACTLVYPATAAKADNTDVKTYAELFATQTGTLSDDLDVRRGTATIQNNGTTASLSGATMLEARNAIVKFSLTDGANALAATQFVIKDGSDNVLTTVTPTATDGASDLYVAMAPADASAFKFEATVNSISYSYEKSTATLAAGKYYQSPLTMTTDEPILSDLTSALEEGAIVAITYTIESVEYTSTFKKEGDEYIEQSTTAAARALTREGLGTPDGTGMLTGKIKLTITDPVTGKVTVKWVDGGSVKLDGTIDSKSRKTVTNFATEGSAVQSVQVNGQKADLVNTETGYAGVQLDNTEAEGEKVLGGIPFTEGDSWEETADIKQENGGQYLQVYEGEEIVYFSANGYTGYLVDVNNTPVRPKDKVGKKTFYLKLSGAISYEEKSWDATNHQVVASKKTVSKYQLVTDSKSGVIWDAGTYVVRGKVTIQGDIQCNGNIKLFLSDGCRLRINGVFVKISNEGKCRLTIYGNGTGKLVNSGSIRDLGDFVIQSGEVEITDYGIIENNNVTMYGGKLSAKTIGNAINTQKGNNITVYGGEVEAISDGGDAIVVGDSDNPGTLTVYGGKVTASAPKGQAIKGYFAKDEGTSVWFYESDTGVWSEPLVEDNHTSTKHYFKAEVDEGPAVVSGTE